MISMLTHWQAWRRSSANYSTVKAQHNEEYYQHCLAVTADTCVGCILLHANPHTLMEDSLRFEGRCADTEFNGSRRLKFDDKVRVYLIPCRSEFSGTFTDLFWQREDYLEFKDDAYQELQSYWKDNNSTVKEAIVALYQPIYSEQVDDDDSREFKVAFMQKAIMVHNDSVGDFAHLVRSSDVNRPSSAVHIATKALYQPAEHESTGAQEGQRFFSTVLLSHVDSVGNLSNIVHSHVPSSNVVLACGNREEEDEAGAVGGTKLWVHNDSVFNFSGCGYHDVESIASTTATDDSCVDVGMYIPSD